MLNTLLIVVCSLTKLLLNQSNLLEYPKGNRWFMMNQICLVPLGVSISIKQKLNKLSLCMDIIWK